MAIRDIHVDHPNGFSGSLYGESSMIISPSGGGRLSPRACKEMWNYTECNIKCHISPEAIFEGVRPCNQKAKIYMRGGG